MTKKIIKNILHKIDLFKDPILLRSKSKSKISTLSFGVISLIILILFTAMFIDKAIDIINADSSEIKSSSYLQVRHSLRVEKLQYNQYNLRLKYDVRFKHAHFSFF